jgi:hypothetical protein
VISRALRDEILPGKSAGLFTPPTQAIYQAIEVPIR